VKLRPESQVIRGWRGRIDDDAEKVRALVSQAPATTVYRSAATAPDSRDLLGHQGWFRRVFGKERSAASEEMHELKRLRARLRYADRTSEQIEKDRERARQRYLNRSPEQIAARRASERAKRAARTQDEIERDRERWQQRKLKRSAEQVAEFRERRRAARVARTQEEITKDREWWRQWRASRPPEWLEKQVAQGRVWREKNSERHKATSKIYRERAKEQLNEARRRRRAAARLTPSASTGVAPR